MNSVESLMMLVHSVVLVFYLRIAYDFHVAFAEQCETEIKAREALMSLSAIFILCAVTRALFEHNILLYLNISLNCLLLWFCVVFVSSNKAATIVHAMKLRQ